MLSQVPLFQDVPLDGLRALADRGMARRFRAGSVLMRQGETADRLYVVLKGRVRVERSHPSFTVPLVLDELGPGQVVGEMGVLDGEPRTATVVAIEDTTAAEIEGDVLGEVLVRNPEVARKILSVVSHRLRSMDDLVAEMAARESAAAQEGG